MMLDRVPRALDKFAISGNWKNVGAETSFKPIGVQSLGIPIL